MVVSLTRKIVTATESKAQAYRVGLPRPTCGVYVAYAKKVTATETKALASRVGLPRPPRRRPHPPTRRRRGLYGSVGAGYGALAGPAAAGSHAQCPAPPAVARPPTAPTQAATARWRALPRRAPTHYALRRPPWRARQPRLRRPSGSVGVGAWSPCTGLGRKEKSWSGFGSPHA